MSAPLNGIRVVDFTRVLAGPFCTKTLRDLGADVIKIEPPSGDVGRLAFPHLGDLSLYFIQQNAGKRNISVDLNWPEARRLVVELCRDADVIVENFRPGTLKRFGLAYEDVQAFNPRVVYASLSGYGQNTSWKNRPAFAPTVQAETGQTATIGEHFGQLRNDAASHADVYTGLQGVVAVLAALRHRDQTGEGQHIDVAMAATMLAVNERAGAQLSGIDTNGEPMALSAPDSHVFELADGRSLVIAASPIWAPMFTRYCAIMRRNDLTRDPRFANARLRRQHLDALLAEVRAWIMTFNDETELQTQLSEAGLAVGQIRTIEEFSQSEWVQEWGAIVDVDDRAGGTTRMPGNPWHFSRSVLPVPGLTAFQGEHNDQVLAERAMPADEIEALKARKILLSRRSPVGSFD